MKLQTESGVIMTTRADVNARNVFQINYFVYNKTRENNGYTGDDDRSHSLYIKNNKQTKMMWLEKT